MKVTTASPGELRLQRDLKHAVHTKGWVPVGHGLWKVPIENKTQEWIKLQQSLEETYAQKMQQLKETTAADLQEKVETLRRQNDSLSSAPAEKVEVAVIPPAVTDSLAEIAARAESLAQSMKADSA